MTDNIHVNLGNVQKTLFLPLWGRAVETKKEKPCLVDETAVRIINQVDYDFSQMAKNMDELSQIAWIQRSLFCDRVIKNFLQNYPEGTIVNIGCGLDTTYDRIDNGKLQWYDLDLPDVIELRKKFIPENERRKFLAISFLEKEWLDQIEVKGNVLFIAAGVFYYFKEGEIKTFMLRLLDKYSNSQLLFDVCSPAGMRVANKKVLKSSGLDEKSYLTWGLEDKNDILAWDARIKLIATYYYFRNLKGLGIRNSVMGMLSDWMGIQYMIHLRLGVAHPR
jgi:O-methyltransferase involved in polyketide biosynthesis